MKVRYITEIEKIGDLTHRDVNDMASVTDKFAFRSNEYYLSLINWDDPFDPLRRVVIPSCEELQKWGHLDPSNEKRFTILPGLEHKYKPTALLIVNNVCGGICRYCFRKRIFMKDRAETLRDLSGALTYIGKHREITNVLLTGGDPLMSSTRRLEEIISKLAKIDHVRIIRIGSKLPAFNPYRIIDDTSLLEIIHTYSRGRRKIYVMTHFNHPRELTEIAVEALGLLSKAGASLCNQTPIIRGVNDEPAVLRELLKKLSFLGVPPYYVFQCRPSKGNKTYAVPVEEAYDIFEQAKRGVAGLAKRARYVISHATGKIEVVGKTRERIYFRYHLAAHPNDSSRFLSFKTNPDAYWFDDYRERIREYPFIRSYQQPYGFE